MSEFHWQPPHADPPPNGEPVLMAYPVRRETDTAWVYVLGCRVGDQWVDDGGSEEIPPDYWTRIEPPEVT